MRRMDAGPVPSFFLYGEAPRLVSPRFLHLEYLDVRSRPSQWRIRAHAHAELHQCFLMRAGAGEVRLAGRTLPFRAPAVFLVPAGAVHGFAFRPELAGDVLTLSTALHDGLAARHPALRGLFERVLVLDAAGQEAALSALLGALRLEMAWTAPGHDAAVEGLLLGVMVAGLRLRAPRVPGDDAGRPVAGPQAVLVARFRELVVAHAHQGWRLRDYAARLGVGLPRLRTACARVAGASPLAIVTERLMLEAQRGLLYSDMSVADLADSLGFTDLAYFSRVFRRRMGASPRAFRQAARVQRR